MSLTRQSVFLLNHKKIMKTIQFKTVTQEFAADLLTPIGIFLKIREQYPNSILLESSDYHNADNSMSFIGIMPKAEFLVEDFNIKIQYPDGETSETKVTDKFTVPNKLNEFTKSFLAIGKAPVNGLFGYCGFGAVQYFENIKLTKKDLADEHIPEICYRFYKYIIAFNHFKNTLTLTENIFDTETSQIKNLVPELFNRDFKIGLFKTAGQEKSTITDSEYMQLVSEGKKHCFRGDVFQIVLSRLFFQQFTGDDFNVYRALRQINPSPYLFYFDYNNYHIFGSSPEAEIRVSEGKAIINPIAGTMRRTGDDEKDRRIAARLAADPKENAEHIMLVDLARNDLSRTGFNVKVEKLKQLQYYSHVIHIVSDVTADLEPNANPIQILADTFPAGTLSGAPKVKAMELIDKYEKQGRSYYAGCIGYIGFDGTVNHAIMIRSFLSKNNTLFYQGGAGIVAASVEENELQEVNNKLGALKSAILKAETI